MWSRAKYFNGRCGARPNLETLSLEKNFLTYVKLSSDRCQSVNFQFFEPDPDPEPECPTPNES